MLETEAPRRIDPRVPPSWERFEITYRAAGSVCEILVENPDRVERGVASLTLDGIAVEEVRLVAGRANRLVVRMG